MSRDDIQKLLGGYATGTLTAEEQEILFAAALEDQELFDALAREQSLRDLLRDPSARARLLTALDEKPAAGWASWWRPAAVGFAMTAVTVLTVVVVRQSTPTPNPAMLSVAKPLEMTKAPAAEPTAAPPPVSTAAPPRAQPELRQTRDKDAAPPENERIAARERPKESDNAAPRREDRPAASGVVGGVAGGAAVGAAGASPAATPPAPVVQEAAAPPPPKSAAEPKAETAASVDTLFARSGRAADLARARPSARLLFLNQMQTVEMMKSFVEPAGQQDQVKQQAQAPSGPRQQQTFSRQNVQLQDAKSLVAPPPLGIRYSVAGSSQLRFETNDDGYIYAMARGLAGVWRVVLSGPAQRMQPHLTTALRSDEKEIFVSFSPQIQAFKAGPSAPEPGTEPATNLAEKEGDITYVVNPLPGVAGRQLSFTIRLP